jgi:hypothetical protein
LKTDRNEPEEKIWRSEVEKVYSDEKWNKGKKLSRVSLHSNGSFILTLILGGQFDDTLILTWGRGATLWQNFDFGKISGSHGGEYEDDVFWDVASCSLIEVYRRFRAACCLHQ